MTRSLRATHVASVVLRGALRAVTAATLALLLSGCIPIGVRVQNMFVAALG